ncbi:MAG: sulfotransferase domain-containing protein [Chloroflexi bacterium]|nr:sulfotransferase domain-containing protein [Chloroflexota bacterium]
MILKSFIRKLGLEKEIKTAIINCGKWGEDFVHLYKKPDPTNSILLAGSGRSGTTWLAGLICGSRKGVQEIFEPIHPTISAEIRKLTGFDEKDPYVRSLYLRPHESYPQWEDLWHRILTGGFRNYWTDYHERWSYFPSIYLVKEIRANLMLGYIDLNFKPKIVFIIRHPCAVIYSRIKKVQKVWQASIRDILKQEDLVHDHLLPWVADIEHESDLVGAHAVWWAIENYIAQKQLSNSRYFFLTYEDLSMNPVEELTRLFMFLDAKKVNISQRLIDKPSRLSSNKGKMERDVVKRLGSWKGGFDEKTQFRILDWAQKFGITLYNEHTLPRNGTSLNNGYLQKTNSDLRFINSGAIRD